MDAGMKLELALRNLGRAGEDLAYKAVYGQATALANITGSGAEALAKFINEQLKAVGYKINSDSEK